MLKKFAKLSVAGGSRLGAAGTLVNRFKKAREGVALVEFALLAPLLLTLMLGSIEITHALWGNGKLAKATSTVVNLIGMTETLDDDEFEDLLAAGPLVMKPYPENDLAMVVTSIIGCLQDPADEASEMDYYVLWSRKWLGGNAIDAPYSINSEFPREPESLKISDGDTILVTEATYTYYPKIARKVGSTIAMTDIAFQQPREKAPVSYAEAGQSDQNCADFRSST